MLLLNASRSRNFSGIRGRSNVSWCLSFQRFTIPPCERRPGFVGTLEELQEHLFRRVCAAHILIAQEEQAPVGVIPGGTGTKRGGRESRRFRKGIRVERRSFEGFIPWPEATTDHFMRVGFACDQIGPWTFRGAPSRKAGHRQVETPPEKMDRAALAEKRGAELLKDLVYLSQDAPEAVSVDGVVGG